MVEDCWTACGSWYCESDWSRIVGCGPRTALLSIAAEPLSRKAGLTLSVVELWQWVCLTETNGSQCVSQLCSFSFGPLRGQRAGRQPRQIHILKREGGQRSASNAKSFLNKMRIYDYIQYHSKHTPSAVLHYSLSGAIPSSNTMTHNVRKSGTQCQH